MKDLYYLLSLEFYGTEEQHNRILNIICRSELEANNVEFFCKFDDSSVTNETRFTDKKKILKTNVERVQNQPKSSADCELYALSSVFHVDIIVDKTGNGNWETYMSVVCTYAGFFLIRLLFCIGSERHLSRMLHLLENVPVAKASLTYKDT